MRQESTLAKIFEIPFPTAHGVLVANGDGRVLYVQAQVAHLDIELGENIHSLLSKSR